MSEAQAHTDGARPGYQSCHSQIAESCAGLGRAGPDGQETYSAAAKTQA